MRLMTAVLWVGLSGCQYVNGLSVVDDTDAPVTLVANFTTPVRVLVAPDCDGSGDLTASPVTVDLRAGARVCFVGPPGETTDYALAARLTSMRVSRGVQPCFEATGAELNARFVHDGRNAASQHALHVDAALCPP